MLNRFVLSIFTLVGVCAAALPAAWAADSYDYSDSPAATDTSAALQELERKISNLQSRNNILMNEAETLKSKLIQSDEIHRNELSQAKKAQEQKLRQEFSDELQKIENNRVAPLTKTLAILNEELKAEIAAGKLSLALENRGLIVTLYQQLLYDAGKATLKSEAFPILNRIAAAILAQTPTAQVVVEGHTDNDPIRKSTWKSNWELSATRALEVLHYLMEKGKLPPHQLAATSYGEFHPRFSNKIPEEKVKNRRVEILVMPQK